MKLTLTFNLDDAQLEHIDNVFQQHQTTELATSKDISRFVGTCIKKVLDMDLRDVGDDIAEHVIKDINAGAWTFIGQPKTTPL